MVARSLVGTTTLYIERLLMGGCYGDEFLEDVCVEF